MTIVRSVIAAVAISWAATSGSALALSVENVRVSNDGSRVIFDFDVEGGSGERGDLVLGVKLKGMRFTNDMMSLEGDSGQVTPGRRKRVVWNLLKDIPRGHNGDLAWDLDVRADRVVVEEPKPQYVPPERTEKRRRNDNNIFGGF